MNAPSSNDSQPRLHLQIISLSGHTWSGEVRQVTLPGSAGRFGVMARHLPMLSTLREGMVHIVPVQGEPLEVYVSGGHVEVQPDQVTVMADLAARNSDLDAARAQAAREAVGSPLATHLTDAAYEQLRMEQIQRYSASLRQHSGK